MPTQLLFWNARDFLELARARRAITNLRAAAIGELASERTHVRVDLERNDTND
jgi:hypothetical protein